MQESYNVEESLKSIGAVTMALPGQHIYFKGDTADRLYYIQKGRVRMYDMTESGRELTVNVLEAGFIFGESAFREGNPRPVSVQAVTRTQLISCRISALLKEMSTNSQLTLALFQMCSDGMDRLTFRMKEQCLLDRYGKTASYILDVTSTESEEKGTMGGVLPYTHEDLANALGLNRSTVTTVLRFFEKKHWIKSGYRYFKILDREALSDLVKQQGQDA